MILRDFAYLRLPRLALGLALTLTPGACVRYREEVISPAKEAARFDARSLSDVASAAGHHRGAWNFDSLTRAALALNPDLVLAKAQIRTALGATETAAARPNPTLGFDGQLTGNLLGGLSPWSLGFSLDIPIETAGKRGYRIAQARHNLQSASLQAASTAWQVRSRVYKNLLDLYASTMRADLFQVEQETQGRIIGSLDERAAAGEIAQPELIQSRLLFNQTQLLLRDAQRLKGESRAGLASSIGVPTTAMENAALDFGEFTRPSRNIRPEYLRRRAMLNRPDVLAAVADYAASEAALHLEVAKQYPDFHFNPGYLFDQGQQKWFITPTVELPVFDQHHGPIREAEGKRAEAAAKLRGIQIKAAGELDRAIAGYRGALKKLEIADALCAGQEKQTRSAKALLESGEGDRLSLLSTQVELDAAKASRLEALIEVHTARGAVEDAAQTPLK